MNKISTHTSAEVSKKCIEFLGSKCITLKKIMHAFPWINIHCKRLVMHDTKYITSWWLVHQWHRVKSVKLEESYSVSPNEIIWVNINGISWRSTLWNEESLIWAYIVLCTLIFGSRWNTCNSLENNKYWMTLRDGHKWLELSDKMKNVSYNILIPRCDDQMQSV